MSSRDYGLIEHFVDDDTIEDIILGNGINKEYVLREVIIRNLPNLRKINIITNKYTYINISNCENLTNIKLQKSDSRNENEVYIGENLNSLENIDVNGINNLEISDEIYENLTSLSIQHVNNLTCNFNSFPNLNILSLLYVEVPNDIFIDSNITKYIDVSNCKTNTIEILGGGHIDRIKLYNNDYRILKVLEAITFSKLYLYNIEKEKRYMPYIPLAMASDDSVYTKVYSSDDSDDWGWEESSSYENLRLIQFDTNTEYDYRYKKFIEDNISEIYLLDGNCNPYDHHFNCNREQCRITLDKIKFTIPTTKKKNARR